MSTVDQNRDGTKVQLIDADKEIEANINKGHDNKETSLEENNAVVEVKRETIFNSEKLEKNNHQKSHKVLGMYWVQSTDETFNQKKIPKAMPKAIKANGSIPDQRNF